MYPTLFISHGAPNILLSNLKSKKNIQNLGQNLKLPKYLIIISAHYVTRDLREPLIINYQEHFSNLSRNFS